MSTNRSFKNEEGSLSDFLWQTPLLFNCHFGEYAKQVILSRCYEELWMNNESVMQQYFFSSKEELLQTIRRQSRPHDGREQSTITDPKSWHSNQILPAEDLSSQKGRQCGHVFRKGEPVYRCRNCGLDDTCVFCSKCFHATNHDGHDILFSVSPGSGGCCDCGDPEAWKVPLQCNIHSLSTQDNDTHTHLSETTSLDPALLSAIRFTIVSVVDFLLDNFAIAPEEVALNPSTEDLLRENRYQRKQLGRIGVPLDRPTLSLSQNTTIMQDIPMDQTETVEEDVDMDKDNGNANKATGFTSKEQDGELYACIAWNDEAHAFSHVLESIMTATGWDWAKAKRIVDVIHVHGREIIAVSTDIEELRKIAAPLSAINLGVTIRPAKETFREQVAGLLVDWLNELISGKHKFFSNILGGDAIIRDMLCEELCREWELRLPLALLAGGPPANEDIPEDDNMKEDVPMINSVTEDIEMYDPDEDVNNGSKAGTPSSEDSSHIMYRSHCDIASIDWDPKAMIREYYAVRQEEVKFGESILPETASKTADNHSMAIDSEAQKKATDLQKEFVTKLRLDYLMLYDLKLWKEIRIALRELYIASLASNPYFKKILGKRLTRNYARLAESFLLRDREPENSIILFSVQLLTVPSVSDLLVHHYYFFGLICSTLTAFFLTDRLFLILPSERLAYPSRINCESRAFRTRRYFNAFHDLRYIMNVNMIKRVLAQDPLYLRQYLDLISLFQGMNGQLCQKDTHVEYESEIWVNAFNVTLQIAKCCRQFSDCFAMLPVSTEQERVDTAITLMRAICRVLKQINEWGKPNPDEEKEEQARNAANTSNTTSTSAYKVYGPLTQTFHQVDTKYVEPIKVIKYVVTEQPVSFHHPLHWLLSGLLEHAHLLTDHVLMKSGWKEGFKSAIISFQENGGSIGDVLLPILDFPIRTIVFSSQIRAGIWVRNGYGIRNQAHHYRDISLRENTYDADVFLLQLGFVTVDTNQFLASLLDRFDLTSWFLGSTTHTSYDSQQTIFMVEELLNLLIVCVCEKANIMGISMAEKIRREIIHNLCLGICAYSELTKRIPERITEHPEFDRILLEVAKFRNPEGVNDNGLYELKEEYFQQVDTYFWHYSRNNREEAENILKSRWKKANPDKNEEEFFILPHTSKINDGPFKYLGQFLHSTLFTQIITYTLWNIRTGDNHKSDTILDQTLYLILLALTDQNNDLNGKQEGFYQNVCDKYYKVSYKENEPEDLKEVSLFDLMTMLYDDEKFSEIKSRLDWIFQALLNGNVERTCQIVQNWKTKQKEVSLENARKKAEGASELSDIEKKKLAAKERQMKIMAQFAQAQSQFMQQNEDLYDEEDITTANEPLNQKLDEPTDTGNLNRFCAYPAGTCIVCQEDVNERSLPYGLLGLIQTSNILRETPLDDDSFYDDIYRTGPTLDVQWEDKQCLPDNTPTISGFPSQSHKTGLYSSTCGHLMHIKCFEVYCTSIDSRHSAQLTRNHPENRSRKEFMCPLCKSLGNVLLPIFWKGKKEAFPGVLEKGDDSDFTVFYKSEVNQIVNKLKKAIGIAWRVAQNKKTSGSTSRMKDVMAQLLPTLPLHGGEQQTTITRPAPPGAIERPDWPPLGLVRTPRPAPTTPTFTEQSNTVTTGSSESSTEGDMDPENDLLFQAAISSGSYSPPDGKLGPFDNEILHTTVIPSIPYIKKSYSRLLDVLSIIYQEICVDEHEREMSTSVKNIDMLWGILGYTITSLEIAARGISRPKVDESTATNTVFDQIPAQAQTLLRVMSDTILAYTTIMCPSGSDSKSNSSMTLARVTMLALGRMRQIFEVNVDDVVNIVNHPGREKIVLYDNAPLLEDDPFMILTELSLHLTIVAPTDIFPFVRTMLLAEMAKIAVGLIQNRLSRAIRQVPDQYHPATSEPSQDIAVSKTFAYSLMNKLQFTPEEAHATFKKFGDDASFCTLLKFFALPFLRRTLILMVSRFGLIIPNNMSQGLDGASEFDRLLNILHLPSFAEFLKPVHMTDSLLHHWCVQLLRESEHKLRVQEGQAPLTASRLLNIPLDLPTPLYLIALPKRLDRLFDESMRRVCHKCGTVPSDPALCLLCGTFVCAQSFCCAEEEEGECNLHTAECGGEIGIFLYVKRCVLLLLHNGNGWFMNAPYLDPHGEVDQGLRHGRPQYLNSKRYAEIRKLWLQHNIPIYVARQIEANYDIGGWTTF